MNYRITQQTIDLNNLFVYVRIVSLGNFMHVSTRQQNYLGKLLFQITEIFGLALA